MSDPEVKPRPATAPTALLIVDVINDLEFPGGEKVLPWAQRMQTRLTPVITAAREAHIAVVYVNDNFGHWRADFNEVVEHCTREGVRGREVVRQLLPGPNDYFILKPYQSGFRDTSLIALLRHLKIERLVLAGIATNLCVLFTAHDAHMMGFEMTVLSDCCAAESDRDHDWALDQLKRFLGVNVCRSDEHQWPIEGSREA